MSRVQDMKLFTLSKKFKWLVMVLERQMLNISYGILSDVAEGASKKRYFWLFLELSRTFFIIKAIVCFVVIEMYLCAENTQQMIANKLEIDQSVVSRTIENFMQNSDSGKCINLSIMSKKR